VLAAIAGVSQGLQNNNIEFRMGFLAGLKAFTAAVLGGIGNLTGAVIGGVAIGIIEAQNVQYGLGSNWDASVIFGILILVLVFKPEGILGRRTTEKV
jgi:branched-chain amino acid transport system permease protein